MATLSVPDDFGNIEHDVDNEFLPYKVTDSYGNYVGNFCDFQRALLALIIVNSHHKKTKAISPGKSKIDSIVDRLYYSTIKDIHPEDCLSTSYFDDNGDLVIGFGAPKIQPVVYTNPMYNNLSNANMDNPLINLTVREVYERWYHDKQYDDISVHTLENYKITYKKIEHLADKIFVNLRFSDINNCVIHEKEVGNSFSMRKRIKLFFSQLYQWAIAHEMCTNNIALNIKLGKNESDFRRKPFSIEQVQELIKVADQISFAGEVAMLILCGCRIGEFLNIQREDIHLDQRWFTVTESKTKVGRGRVVPIHKKVMRFWRSHLRAKSDYLIHDARGRQMKYEIWSAKFHKLMKHLEWEGMSIHGCRHTCVTLLHTFGADPYDSRAICGHTQPDVESRVYLHIQAQSLVKAIDLIKI